MNKKAMHEYENLCALGLPEHELAQLAVETLNRVIGGAMFSYIRANARLEAEDVFLVEALPERYTKVYFEEFYNRGEAEVGPTFTEILRKRIPLVNFSNDRVFNSGMYAEVFKPIGFHHALRVSVIDEQRCYGMFAVGRGRSDRPYSEAELALLRHAARCLAHGFELARTSALVRDETVESRDEGFLLLSRNGVVLHGCERGLRLFHEATRADGVAQQADSTRETLPRALAAQARAGGPTKDCVLANRRGAFVFRPFLLHSPAPGGAAPVAVRVHRRGSMALRLWQETERFKLSGRERQTAVLLGLGEGYDAIAARLGVSRNTAVSYVRRTYEKVGTRQREQLLGTLLSQ